MRLLAATDRIARPWKNGGGVTFDVLSFPEGSTLENFGWRISIAEVASDGPFSRFEGIDRSTAILRGRGSASSSAMAARKTSARCPPLAYPGDVATDCTLLNGPVRDLNVMTRRGIYRHRLRLVSGEVRPRARRCSSARADRHGSRSRMARASPCMTTMRWCWPRRFQSDEPVWLVELLPV